MTRKCWGTCREQKWAKPALLQRNDTKYSTLIYDKVANIQSIHKLEKHPDLDSSAF